MKSQYLRQLWPGRAAGAVDFQNCQFCRAKCTNSSDGYASPALYYPDMTLAEIARLRLLNQRLTSTSLTRPADVVRCLGAVQSQDLASSLYAIGLRMKNASETIVEQAIADKSIVRSWLMRRTIHLMPAEDTRWMIRTLAPRHNRRMAHYYRRAGLTDEVLKRTGKVIQAILAGGKQLTRPEIYQALQSAGIRTDEPKDQPRGLHMIVHWAQAGLICFTPRRGKQHTFGLLDEWVPRGNSFSGDEALAQLAKRYFHSHGPATVKDFAWWAGLTLAEARRGMEPIKGRLESAIVSGAEYWFEGSTRSPRPKTPAVLLLPPFDEYTVAYADRCAAVSKGELPQTGHGIAPTVIAGGRIAAIWKRTLMKDQVLVSIKLLRRLTSSEHRELKQAARRYGASIGKTAILET